MAYPLYHIGEMTSYFIYDLLDCSGKVIGQSTRYGYSVYINETGQHFSDFGTAQCYVIQILHGLPATIGITFDEAYWTRVLEEHQNSASMSRFICVFEYYIVINVNGRKLYPDPIRINPLIRNNLGVNL